MTMVWHTWDDAATELRALAARSANLAGFALVVAQDQRIQRWAGRRLQQAGFEVLLADDGMNALAAAHDDPPDLVVLDHVVAGVDVRYVLIQLRRDPATAHVSILLIAPTVSSAFEDVCHTFGVMLLVTGVRKPHAQLHVHLPGWSTRRTALAETGDQLCQWRL